MPLLTPNHNIRTCGGPEAFNITRISKQCGGKSKLRSGGTLHPEDPLGDPLPAYIYIYIHIYIYTYIYIYVHIYIYVFSENKVLNMVNVEL